METSALAALSAANIAGSLAILAVLALRLPARKLFGARLAYGLWLLAPLAAAATFLPAASVTKVYALYGLTPMTREVVAAAVEKGAPARLLNLPTVLMAVWLAGAAFWIVRTLVAQRRAVRLFGALIPEPGHPGLTRAAKADVGPALIGLIRPKLVIPADFERRFDAREQAMILAHEQAHLRAGHLWANAFVSLMRAVNWFNPLVHIAARLVRVDQELACDAAVVGAFPGERRTYAKALMKTQLDAAQMPLGCYWPVRAPNLLRARLETLGQALPGRGRVLAGIGAVGALSLATGFGVWAAQPPRVIFVKAPEPMAVTYYAAPVTHWAEPAAAAAPAVVKARARPAVTPPPSEKDAALASGDWRRAAISGASAAEILMALQAKGRYGDLDPGKAVVAIARDGAILRVSEMEPLPPLPEATAAPMKTVTIGGFSDGFGSPAGTIILRPPYAESYFPYQ